MLEINLIKVQETCGLNLSDSNNFQILSDLLNNHIEYDGWTYDYATNILTISIHEHVIIGDLSKIGVVI